MVRRISTASPAWKCPHCRMMQLWEGKSSQALIACKFCRGISLINTAANLATEEREGFRIMHDFPAAILGAICEEENE